MKKSILNKFKSFLILILVVPLAFVFSACTKNGKSAYEIALDNGFVGTEQEWLNSLKGTNGKNGENASSESSFEMWQKAKESGEFSGTYLDFIQKYFSGNEDMSVATNMALSSVVEITTENGSGGSGVIFEIDSENNAFIITNYHVAYQHTSFYIKLFGTTDDDKFTASLVGGSSTYDLAVLYAENADILEANNAKPANLNLNSVSLGSTCIAVGNTNLKGLNVMRGCISKDTAFYSTEVAGNTTKHRYLCHTTPITNGNSGGGLFNSKGELIGITNGGLKSTSTIDNSSVKLAIPASIVYSVTKNIIANCFNQTNSKIIVCDTGLEFRVSSKRELNLTTGLLDLVETLTVSKIADSSPFAELVNVGDKLLNFKITTPNETIAKTVTRSFELDDLIMLLTSNSSLELTFERAGETNLVVITKTYSELNPTAVA